MRTKICSIICLILLVIGAPKALATNQESYEATIMDTSLVLNTRESTFSKIHSIKIMEYNNGVIKLVVNVEVTKTDGTFEYEQYTEELQAGSQWYNQTVVNGQLVDVRE